ncbi:hypothetical protein LCGC14_0411830 [marine sediment metagenome]|uniref:Uncharacterized protein n=1 Tax=marine sediment metagenome TaxID=412755 RepID=A0A0F9VFL6_9ZZZZ
MAKLRDKFTKSQRKAGKVLAFSAGILFLGMVTMSALGAERGSFHVISLTSGWTGEVWNALWLVLTALTFLLLGGILSTMAEDSDKFSGGEE